MILFRKDVASKCFTSKPAFIINKQSYKQFLLQSAFPKAVFAFMWLADTSLYATEFMIGTNQAGASGTNNIKIAISEGNVKVGNAAGTVNVPAGQIASREESALTSAAPARAPEAPVASAAAKASITEMNVDGTPGAKTTITPDVAQKLIDTATDLKVAQDTYTGQNNGESSLEVVKASQKFDTAAGQTGLKALKAEAKNVVEKAVVGALASAKTPEQLDEVKAKLEDNGISKNVIESASDQIQAKSDTEGSKGTGDKKDDGDKKEDSGDKNEAGGNPELSDLAVEPDAGPVGGAPVAQGAVQVASTAVAEPAAQEASTEATLSLPAPSLAVVTNIVSTAATGATTAATQAIQVSAAAPVLQAQIQAQIAASNPPPGGPPPGPSPAALAFALDLNNFAILNGGPFVALGVFNSSGVPYTITGWAVDPLSGLPVATTVPPAPAFAPTQQNTSEMFNESGTYIKKKEDITLWAQIMGNRDRQFSKNGDAGSVSTGRGFVTGFDKEYSSTETIGLALSANQIDIKPENSPSKTVLNSYMMIGNYVNNFDVVSLSVSAFVGLNRSKTKSPTGSYAYLSKLEGVNISLSKPLQVNGVDITPSLSTNGSLTQQNAYRDNSSYFYKSQSQRSLSSSIALELAYGFTTSNDFSHKIRCSQGASLNLTAKPNPLTVDTGTFILHVNPSRQSRITYLTSVGYALSREGLSCEVNYNLQLKSRFIGQSVTLKIGKKF